MPTPRQVKPAIVQTMNYLISCHPVVDSDGGLQEAHFEVAMHPSSPTSHVCVFGLDLLLLHLLLEAICVHDDLIVELVQVVNVLRLQVFQLIDLIFSALWHWVHLALNMRP